MTNLGCAGLGYINICQKNAAGTFLESTTLSQVEFLSHFSREADLGCFLKLAGLPLPKMTSYRVDNNLQTN
ncbi:hypothetical protein Y1Q_0023680 [Alligator mississippiensis]|uniref:Uncharacterized protein n=1 Tax=Alligator mississippiensis TaxID=8496 RepID=A0A151NCK0_ALLMI|nr:hypothetical protein Y1Q_0023680 [Alligator mississippiensis]